MRRRVYDYICGVQHKTAFCHAPEVAAALAAHSFGGQGPPGRADPPPAVLGLLHGLLACAVEVIWPHILAQQSFMV